MEAIGKILKPSKKDERGNHLGNVLTTFSDKKLYQNGKYIANITSAQDYYAFGMLMGARSFSSDNAKYGFNGQEKDDEIKGSGVSYSFKYRIYDSRLGRFLSVDPLAKEYPWNSPYAFAENRVIDGIDLEGLEYKSAGKWASDNLTGMPYSWEMSVKGYSYYKKPKLDKFTALMCTETVVAAYANANSLVSDYLQKQGMPANYFPMVSFFKRGGEFHSFIDAKDYSKADVGDALLLRGHSGGSNHAAIMNSKITKTKNGILEFSVLTTNGNAENEFDQATYRMKKNSAGKWYLYQKKIAGSDQWATYGDSEYVLDGFGRVDEEGINSQNQDATKENSSSTLDSSSTSTPSTDTTNTSTDEEE